MRIKFTAYADPEAVDGNRIAFGLTNTIAGSAFNDETNTANCIKLVWKNVSGTDTLFTCTANGTAATNPSTTAYSISTRLLYEIVWTYGVDVKFYINGSLFSTHTTNIPTSSGAI